MPLEGHWERQQTPIRALGRRERRIIAVALALLLAGIVALVVLGAGRSDALPAGCIEFGTPSTTGGARVRACGASAHQACREQARLSHPDAKLLARCARLSR